MNVFRCTVYLYFHIFKQRNQNIQHHFFYHFQFFHLIIIRPKHTICFYSMIQKFKLFIDILFIYICKPFSYTSIRAQTRENYKIYLITEGTVLFFLKVSNISFACLRLVGRIRRNQQHTCTCSEFYKQKAHFHRN